MMNPAVEELELTIFSQLDELRSEWERQYPERAEGGQVALTGFNHQFLLTLWKIVVKWKASDKVDRQDLRKAQEVLAEAISDITEAGRVVTFTQVKRTLSEKALRDALEELWLVFNLAFDCTPELAKHLRFVISGQYEGEESPEKVIRGWRTRSPEYPQEKLKIFKDRVYHQIVADPKEDLATELQTLARDEDSETTIARWLGYLLQIGSGFSPESISTFIWKELANDGSIEAFRATLARLFSLSHSRLCAVRETLGDRITFPRAKLSDLRASLLEKSVTLLIGPSGSGKSALCKISIQQDFKQNFDCLFLHASDIASFTESSDVIANRGLRRLDELLIARITQKPTLIVIDDLSDVDDQHFDAVLNLLHNTLTASTLADVRFVLVAHTDAKHRINEKISTRFGNNFVYADVELPQLPIEELKSSEDLPDSIIGLIHRHREFGPALNLKLIDWLVRSVQREQIDISVFRNDLDLLTWFWCSHVQNGQDFSALGQALIKIAEELANRFTPDLPCYFDSSIENGALRALVLRDCLRIVDGRLATTHRFVGDCARFYYLRGNRREIESEQLVEWLLNPFWVQPIRWFALQLALESSEGGTWQEFLCEALEGDHLQLLDLLLDGAIFSKRPGSVLQGCPDENLPFVIERLITRLLAIATEPYPFHADGSQSTPLRTRIAIQEQITGIPKPDLWEPVWHWLLSQNSEALIEESCIFFRAAEAWLSWGVHEESFPLRHEVANFTLDLAQKVLLPDPDPESIWRRGLDDFESNTFVCSNAFACIVFSLKTIPERSSWFLRSLAGREIVPANRLEAKWEITGTAPSYDLLRVLYGNGVLQPGHPHGPRGIVNHQFRKFMLSQNGLYLNAVICHDLHLGIELFLALTIESPKYRYEYKKESIFEEKNIGIVGSDDIDVCTFKFLPFLSLLQINEETAIDVIATLCKIATHQNYEIRQRFDQTRIELETENQTRTELENKTEVETLLSSLRTDAHELTLIINKTRKQFQGERKTLYWHRNCLTPKILACLLMTLEGWLYSRPTKSQLEHSISLILKRSDTVAMLGVLVSLAKCDSDLLSGSLLPLISSLQLLVWLGQERFYHDQGFGFDTLGARRNLQEMDRQELWEFNQLPYRTDDLQAVILRMWINEIIPLSTKSQILEDWDDYQFSLIPEISQNLALEIRGCFEQTDSKREQLFSLIGNPLKDSIADAKAQSNFQYLIITATCRKIIDGEREKISEIHDELVNLLTSKEQLNLFKQNLNLKAFNALIWAMISAVLEFPNNKLEEKSTKDLDLLAQDLLNLHINLLDDLDFCRSHNNDLDAEVFKAHAAPKLLKRLESKYSVRASAFRCLIGSSNLSTCTFTRSWLKEYGVLNPLTQELISLAPLIARLMALTDSISYLKTSQQEKNDSDFFHNMLQNETSDQSISNKKDSQIEEAWLNLQNNFSESKLQLVSIVDVFEWIPEVLTQSIQQMPYWSQNRFIRHSFDWEFLTAALVPVLEVKVEEYEVQRLINSLCEQVIFALLHERASVYVEYKADQENNGHSGVHTHLHQAQAQLLDAVIRHNHANVSVQINKLLHVLGNFNLIDCILLEHVIDTLGYDVADSSITEVNNVSLRSQIALAIGDYLFEFRNQPASSRILGKVSDVWEKLIELLSRESRVAADIAYTDQSLVQFFNRFQDVLLPHWWLRRKLYRVAKLTEHKRFRQTIFKALLKHQDLMPTSRNDESEILVQVLAELWDSDYTWIINRQSRCQDLRTLLGQLQKIDAVGARSLADQVANFLSSG